VKILENCGMIHLSFLSCTVKKKQIEGENRRIQCQIMAKEKKRKKKKKKKEKKEKRKKRKRKIQKTKNKKQKKTKQKKKQIIFLNLSAP
jgi:sRNA-binding protein